MGMDCTMYLYNNKTGSLSEELIDGRRNSEWFRKIQIGDNNFPNTRIDKDDLPTDIKGIYDRWEDDGYCLTRVNAKEFLNWVEEYKPQLDAGWCTKREAWEYKVRNIEPDFLKPWLTDEDIVADMEFIEVENQYDMNVWLMNTISNVCMGELADCYLYYWFDC